MQCSAPPSTLPGKSLPSYLSSFTAFSIPNFKVLNNVILFKTSRARGWARLGAAQLCLGHPTAAASAYVQGLKLDSKNEEMLTGMELANRASKKKGGTKRRAAMHHSDS